MKILDGLRATGTQNLRSTDEFGNIIEMTLYFRAAVSQWFLDLSVNGFQVNRIRISNSANMLWPFQRLFRFGLAVIIQDGSEPFLINDFSTGRVLLAILTEAEVDEVNDYYVGLKE